MSYRDKWKISPEQIQELFAGAQSVAKRFIITNFRKQGFQDGSVKAWKPKKKNDGRNILVGKSNPHMIQSFHFDNTNKNSVRITNSKKYSGIHNEGSSYSLLAGSRATFFKTKIKTSGAFYTNKNGKLIQRKSTKTIEIRGASIGVKKHTRNMPERRMIGESKTLDLMIDKDVARRMKKVFKK